MRPKLKLLNMCPGLFVEKDILCVFSELLFFNEYLANLFQTAVDNLSQKTHTDYCRLSHFLRVHHGYVHIIIHYSMLNCALVHHNQALFSGSHLDNGHFGMRSGGSEVTSLRLLASLRQYPLIAGAAVIPECLVDMAGSMACLITGSVSHRHDYKTATDLN